MQKSSLKYELPVVEDPAFRSQLRGWCLVHRRIEFLDKAHTPAPTAELVLRGA